MKHLFKKSLQVSFASIVAIKAADIYRKQDNTIKFPFLNKMAEAASFG